MGGMFEVEKTPCRFWKGLSTGASQPSRGYVLCASYLPRARSAAMTVRGAPSARNARGELCARGSCALRAASHLESPSRKPPATRSAPG